MSLHALRAQAFCSEAQCALAHATVGRALLERCAYLVLPFVGAVIPASLARQADCKRLCGAAVRCLATTVCARKGSAGRCVRMASWNAWPSAAHRRIPTPHHEGASERGAGTVCTSGIRAWADVSCRSTNLCASGRRPRLACANATCTVRTFSRDRTLQADAGHEHASA